MKKIDIWYILGDLFLGTIKFKLDKKDWYFRKSNTDINPSFSHLHSKDHKYKMNIYTRDIYLKKGKETIYNNFR